MINTIPPAVDLLSLEPQVPWVHAGPVAVVATIAAVTDPSTTSTRLIGPSEQYVARSVETGYLVRPGKG